MAAMNPYLSQSGFADVSKQRQRLGLLEPVRHFFECETLSQVAAVAGVGDSDSVLVVFENRKIPERPNQSRFLSLG